MPNKNRNRSKNKLKSSCDLSTTSLPDNNPESPRVHYASGGAASICLDQSLSIRVAAVAADNVVDTTCQDAATPPDQHIPSSGTRRGSVTGAEEQQLSQAVEQSLSEMALVTTNKPPGNVRQESGSSSSSSSDKAEDRTSVDRMFMPPPQSSPSQGTPRGHGTVEDPFARERQKRLLPSNTVSLGAGSFEGRLDVAQPMHLHQEEMCHTLIRDLNKYGVCVLDEFMGEKRGEKVLSEVVTMYSAGKFMDGQLVQPSTKTGEIRDLKHIRGDKITWIGGREPGCANIGYLINQVDSVITMANKMQNNGKLGQYQIRERTKAMVACYPGSGTHYVKHVDNPTRDGRCITAIYYLNPNWDAASSGGLLRMFPENLPVVDIAPQFDRILFFWSDRRNPHEVQPAHRTRYAITLWYHDAVEREKALHRYQRENLKRQQEQEQDHRV